jgi:hypothetical protein
MFSRSGAAGAGAGVCAKAGDKAKAKMPTKSKLSFENKERTDIYDVPLKTG